MFVLSSNMSSCNSQSRNCGGGGVTTTSTQRKRRNRKTHVYVSSDDASLSLNNNYNDEKQEEQGLGVEHSMMMTTVATASKTQYKWTQHFTSAIQSTFEFLLKLILTTVSFLWNWTTNTFLFYFANSENSLFKVFWNYILATMTIEIVTTTTDTNKGTVMDSTKTISTLTSLPVLRLNSVTMEETEEFLLCNGNNNGILLEDDEDKIDCGIESGSDFIQSNSSNYNSSDGEQDTIVFTDDESQHEKNVTTSLASTLEYLEKQQQQFATRRDSDSSCDGGSNCNEAETKQNNDVNNENSKTNEDVAERIIKQVETMFSDDHLAKDGFLLKHVRRRSDGFVSLKLVAGLRKVKQISRDFQVVVEALRKAEKVEVNADGSKVRRVEPLTPLLKSIPTSNGSSKDKENNNNQKSRNNSRNGSMDIQLSDSELAKCMRVNGQINNNNNTNYQRRVQRFSNASTTSGSSASPPSSVCSSRNSSFSYQAGLPGGDLFNRNNYNGSGEDDLEQVLLRRRGASLPINAHQQKRHSHSSHTNSYLNPTCSPTTSPSSYAPGQNRPKSNSYCEGTNITNGSSPGGMSLWLQKRLASTRTSEGNIQLAAAVIRQPRGPDGTKGFATGYRQMILEEKQVRERKMGQQMI